MTCQACGYEIEHPDPRWRGVCRECRKIIWGTIPRDEAREMAERVRAVRAAERDE